MPKYRVEFTEIISYSVEFETKKPLPEVDSHDSWFVPMDKATKGQWVQGWGRCEMEVKERDLDCDPERITTFSIEDRQPELVDVLTRESIPRLI